jgi:hypothetical protein
MASSVTTWTSRPRRSSRSCLIATRSRRCRPDSRSMRRSRSLSGPAVPQANEPKTRTLVAPCAFAIRRMSVRLPRTRPVSSNVHILSRVTIHTSSALIAAPTARVNPAVPPSGEQYLQRGVTIISSRIPCLATTEGYGWHRSHHSISSRILTSRK